MKRDVDVSLVEDTIQKVYSMWVADYQSYLDSGSEETYNYEVMDIHWTSYICRYLHRRMNALATEIRVPDYLGLILDECTNCNPEQSLWLLYEIIQNLQSIPSLPYIIVPSDYSRVFQSSPIMWKNDSFFEGIVSKWGSWTSEDDSSEYFSVGDSGVGLSVSSHKLKINSKDSDTSSFSVSGNTLSYVDMAYVSNSKLSFAGSSSGNVSYWQGLVNSKIKN